jgi:hypothetical protein
MAIKVFVEKENNKGLKFPCILSHPHFKDQQIILATSYCEEQGCFIGTNINGIGWPVGHYSKGWDKNFKPFPGVVTLSNAPEVAHESLEMNCGDRCET